MKRILSALVVLGLVGSAWAGSPADAAKMSAMKAEMSKCAVCKHMAAKMDEIGPVSMQVVHLDNGVAIQSEVQDASKVAVFHAVGVEMSKAGEATMKMTDAQAKTDLCPMCQDMRSAAMKGANISHGQTKTGSLCVIASNDAAVQKDIAAFEMKCAAMMGEGDPHAGHGH
jgi:hypothetical protein